jgi:16S rRNA processing protein RimM
MKPGTMVPTDLVEVGFLRGAYGLQGWVHVQPHSGDADVLRGARQWWLRRPKAAAAITDADERAALLEITGVRAQGSGLVAKWHGCDDPESAQALKGCGIAVSRASFPRLPQGQYYWVDLVGSQVVNRAGRQLGVVSGLRNNGAHDLLEVEREIERTAPAEGGATQAAAEELRPAPSGMLLIPMVPAYIDGVELAARRIRVDWEADWS